MCARAKVSVKELIYQRSFSVTIIGDMVNQLNDGLTGNVNKLCQNCHVKFLASLSTWVQLENLKMPHTDRLILV